MVISISWREALEPVVSERLVKRSFEYIREVVVADLIKQSVATGELDRIAYLESVKRICEVYPEMPQLKEVRAELAKLKRKHKARLKTKRKQLMKKWQ